MAEPLQVDAQRVREDRHPRVFQTVAQLLASLAAVHVVVLELVGGEEGGEAVVEGDVGPVEPRRQPGWQINSLPIIDWNRLLRTKSNINHNR